MKASIKCFSKIGITTWYLESEEFKMKLANFTKMAKIDQLRMWARNNFDGIS